MTLYIITYRWDGRPEFYAADPNTIANYLADNPDDSLAYAVREVGEEIADSQYIAIDHVTMIEENE